jgi:hypothetical protein
MNLWGRLGISVAFAGLFCIFMTNALQSTAYYERYKWYLCGGFALSGIIFFLVGRRLNASWRARQLAQRRYANKDQDPNEEEPLEDRFLLVNVAYWGVMLLVFAALTALIVPRFKLVHAATIPQKTNPPAPPKPLVVVAAPTNEPPRPRQFPKLVLQGVSFGNQKPAVIINGKTLSVGDHISEATIVAISPYGATVEFDGRSETLAIGK